jgi:hypothetical protein
MIFANPWFQVGLPDHLNSVLTSQQNQNLMPFIENEFIDNSAGKGKSHSVCGIRLESIHHDKVLSETVGRIPQRYQFGIGSHAQEPLEVMHEVYKTLGKLGAEWIGHQQDDDKYTSIDPFIIKCRWRKRYPCKVENQLVIREGQDDLYVYMDIQLYQREYEDYLLDFRWCGYEFVESTRELESPRQQGVHSAFPFLDLVTNLITALERGGH